MDNPELLEHLVRLGQPDQLEHTLQDISFQVGKEAMELPEPAVAVVAVAVAVVAVSKVEVTRPEVVVAVAEPVEVAERVEQEGQGAVALLRFSCGIMGLAVSWSIALQILV